MGGFPSVDRIKQAVPAGRLPYIQASQALNEIGCTVNGYSGLSIPQKRAVVGAVREFVDNAEQLSPPLPKDLLGLLGQMVDVFDVPVLASGDPRDERVFDDSPKAFSAAVFALRAAVDHGQGTTCAPPGYMHSMK